MIMDYWHFTRKVAQMDLIFYLSQTLLDYDHIFDNAEKRTIRALNIRRINSQHKIGILSAEFSNACLECNDQCCGREIEFYFTAIDYWIRIFSGNKIKPYGMTLPRSWHYNFSKLFKKLFKKMIRFLSPKGGKFGGGVGCSKLGDNGCTLYYANRPIKCVVATCPVLRRSLSGFSKRIYYNEINELFSISKEMFNLMKASVKISRRYGEIAIMLTL